MTTDPTKSLCGAAVLAAVFLSPTLALGADDEFAAGKAEYMAACAACHGEAADGNGPIASMFREKVPDLTGLAARNDGEFPFLDVFHVVDGRSAIRAHGNPMPVFGNRYQVDAEHGNNIFGAESLVRARVTELVLYLQSIQQ